MLSSHIKQRKALVYSFFHLISKFPTSLATIVYQRFTLKFYFQNPALLLNGSYIISYRETYNQNHLEKTITKTGSILLIV